MPAPNRDSAQTWLGLGVLCLAAGVNQLQSSALSPLLPSIGRDFATSDAATGQLATIGSLVGFAFSLAATPWMDRWSRRTWFRLEGLMILAGLLLSALAPGFAWLALGRVLAASGASLIMANCMTGARELFPDSAWRNRAIGFIVSATTLVFIVGLPIVTQIGASFGWRTAMASIALPAMLLLAGTFVLPDRRDPDLRLAPRVRPLAALREVMGDRWVRSLLVVLTLLGAIYAGWFVYFGAYATDVFAVTASMLSLLFLLSGGTQLVANNLAPMLVRRFAPTTLLYVSMVGLGATLLLTGIAVTTLPAALLAAVIVLNGCGIAYIAANVLLLDSGSAHPGAVMSLAAAAGSLGAALGPLITGVALAGTGSNETAYRVLGLLAPVCMLTLWAGTRQRAAETVIEPTT